MSEANNDSAIQYELRTEHLKEQLTAALERAEKAELGRDAIALRNREITAEIGKLRAELAELEADKGRLVEVLKNGEHPQGCPSNKDSCVECGWEYDEHPVSLVGGRKCLEFVDHPCDCWIRDALDAAMYTAQKERGK
jgi:hypothetical protein